MFVPNGYLEFRRAAALIPDADDDWGSDDPKGECSGGALASGDLIGYGVVIGAQWDGEVEELGQIQELKPEVWRMPDAREAVLGTKPTGRLYQDGFVLTPIIQRAAFWAWRRAESSKAASPRSEQPSPCAEVAGLSYGVHAIPAGYVAFDRISSVARVWAKDGNIDPDLMLLLDPPDTDAMTESLASGALRAFGISKRTGAIVSLPPAIWRMEVSGAPQSIWAISGNDVLSGPDGEACLPVITRADLARCFQAKEVPPDPDELPEGWQAAVPLARPSSGSSGDIAVDSWMRGLAQGYKLLGNTLKRDDAVKAATTYLRCKTRQAEAAYEALPYPELRNPPRTPTA
jgi:hypothetical protein